LFPLPKAIWDFLKWQMMKKKLNAFVCIYWNNQTSFVFYSVNYMDWFFNIVPTLLSLDTSHLVIMYYSFLYLTRFNLPIFSLIEKLKFTITNYSLKKWNTKQQCGNFLISELFIILKYVCVSCLPRSSPADPGSSKRGRCRRG